MRSVSIANHHPHLRLDRRAVTRVIRTLDANPGAFAHPSEQFLSGELSLVFLTDRALAQLHADFMEDPSVTDVITFEGDPAHATAGEICVSADAAARHVGRHAGRPARRVSQAGPDPHPDAFSTELTLYLVHGWLHLAGYDDLAPAGKRVMRRAEARAMTLLRESGVLPRFVLAER
jgi:probable rRNA maturation factor